MKYSILTGSELQLCKLNKYEELMESCLEASYFHTQEYLTSLLKCKHTKPLVIAIVEGKMNLLALAIGETSSELRCLSVFTKRTIFYAPPIYSSLDALKALVGYLCQVPAGILVQIRHFHPMTDSELSIYRSSGFMLKDHLNAFIKINDLDAIYNKFSRDKKKRINQAINIHHIELKEMNDIDAGISCFYDMLKSLYRRKGHGLKDREYFHNLVNESKGNVRIVFAYYRDLPVATQLYIIQKNRLTALYAATIDEYKNLHSGDFIIWNLIQLAYDKNICYFDFGGGGNPTKPYGPRDYKSRFGTEFVNVGRLDYYPLALFKYAVSLYHLLKNK